MLPTVTWRVRVAGAVVPSKLAVSQPVAGSGTYETVAVSSASLPLPTFVTASVCAAGLAPPCVAVNATLAADNPMIGDDGGVGPSPPHRAHITPTPMTASRDHLRTLEFIRMTPPRLIRASAGVLW